MIVLCLASTTTPRRRNLLVALAQYTETHFRSSSWFLSSLLLNRGSLNRGSTVVQFIRGKKASFPIPVLQAPVVQTLDSAIHRINRYPADKCYAFQLRYRASRRRISGRRFSPSEESVCSPHTTFSATGARLVCGHARSHHLSIRSIR